MNLPQKPSCADITGKAMDLRDKLAFLSAAMLDMSAGDSEVDEIQLHGLGIILCECRDLAEAVHEYFNVPEAAV